ncbi:hypothetical protein XENTR_v10003686 [Xenopus tropicalis]|nr:hypothetical protein XENTR_v10003686 [Xenopus tropicalis]
MSYIKMVLQFPRGEKKIAYNFKTSYAYPKGLLPITFLYAMEIDQTVVVFCKNWDSGCNNVIVCLCKNLDHCLLLFIGGIV